MSATSPTQGQAAPSALRPRRRLAIRLAWITLGAVLLVQAMFIVPSLVRHRQEWLDRRLTEAQLAAVSASVAAGGSVDRATRDELLRLAGAEAIRLERAGRTETLLAADGAQGDAPRTDPRQESFPASVVATFASLLGGGDALVSIAGPSPLRGGATVISVLREQDLHLALVRHIRRIGSISLGVAVGAAALLYLALLGLLVRPIRQLTESITAFRADPERSAPLDATRLARFHENEIDIAARELAAMQQELRGALWRNARLAALGAAMAKVNHDLRGILSPAMLTAERLQRNPDPAVQRAGDVLLRAIERAAELTRRTLEFAGETPLALPRRRMALRPAVEEAAEQARAACPMLSVSNHVLAEIEIDADRESLVRVLGNLLRNAGEADALRASVSAGTEGDELVIVVADDGCGLPEAVRAALFRPFVTGGRRGSTGLGLAIVHDLMQAHGGEVVLLDTGPEGTRFQLTLPRRAIHVGIHMAASAK